MTPEKARRMRDLSDELLAINDVLETKPEGVVRLYISIRQAYGPIWSAVLTDGPIVDAILAELERRRREIDAELEAL